MHFHRPCLLLLPMLQMIACAASLKPTSDEEMARKLKDNTVSSNSALREIIGDRRRLPSTVGRYDISSIPGAIYEVLPEAGKSCSNSTAVTLRPIPGVRSAKCKISLFTKESALRTIVTKSDFGLIVDFPTTKTAVNTNNLHELSISEPAAAKISNESEEACFSEVRANLFKQPLDPDVCEILFVQEVSLLNVIRKTLFDSGASLDINIPAMVKVDGKVLGHQADASINIVVLAEQPSSLRKWFKIDPVSHKLLSPAQNAVNSFNPPLTLSKSDRTPLAEIMNLIESYPLPN